jgi:hypothetical protein
MLKLKDSAINQHFLQANTVEEYENYYRDVILPEMRKGHWDHLQEQVVIKLPNGNDIIFGANRWNLNAIEPAANVTVLFTNNGKILERNITNELKTFALARIFTGRKSIALDTLRADIDNLKKIALFMLEEGIDSFSKLNDDNLKSLLQENTDILGQDRMVSVLNVLIDYYEALPFEIHYSKQTSKKLGITYREQKQNLVIPPRIYTQMLNSFSDDIGAVKPHLNKMSSEIIRMLDIEKNFKEYLFQQLRSGKATDKFPFNTVKTYNRVLKRFKQEGVELIDHFKTEERKIGLWQDIINDLKPAIISVSNYVKNTTWHFEPFQVGEKRFTTIGKFKDFLYDLEMKCKALCLFLSGMRTDELNSMHPRYGAQSYKYNGQTIHLFTTRQSKITSGIQTEEDTFITSQVGHNAFKVLTTINDPFLARIDDCNKISFFASIKQSNYPYTLGKSKWRSNFSVQINKWIELNVDNTLIPDDVSFIRISNPSNSEVVLGGRYIFNPHQTRRTFAFYMIGLELMAFPHLKKQLSHLSFAMTRHYANNATYWGALRQEVNSERVLQKSSLLSKVYKRLAESGSIAGGKGKTLKKLSGNSTFFEQGDADKRLNPNYWKKLIENGKEHIHAIAPGMYCTNSKCDMRINIALDECVDCEFDFIMDGLYAEGKRLAAHRNLIVLDETAELTASVASQLVVQIKSCERILSDLEITFTPIIIPESASSLLINTTVL